jgi:formylglycine-generating enzyme required for sulfatase activity
MILGVKRFRLMTDQGDKGRYDIAPFFMAKYLITYEQFQVFVDDPQGFKNGQWWEGLAAEAQHRQSPGQQRFTHDRNLPCETVSWYDGVAFCRWLTSRVGYEVRLPTEWEWQWAAQGPDGREYPYQGAFDPAKGNTRETGIGGTTPVGSYPQGASPYGVLDMSGNIWEWCLNEYGKPENTGLAGSASRVVRGGAFNCDSGWARASYRGYSIPYDRYVGCGFRVVGVSVPVLGR